MARWKTAKCLYCGDPVGPDGETDDGEFFVCAECRRQSARRQQEVVSGMALAHTGMITNEFVRTPAIMMAHGQA